MSELYKKPEKLPATTESIYSVAREWVANPTAQDPGIALMGNALMHLIEDSPAFRSTTDDALTARQNPGSYFHKELAPSPIGAELATNIVRTAIQYNLLRFPAKKRFPTDFHTAGDLADEVKSWFVAGQEDLQVEYWTNVERRFMLTNRWERAVAVPIAKILYGSEFPRRIRAVDLGCSQNEVWAQLVLGLPFNNFHILRDDPSKSGGLLIPDPYLTNRLSQSINKPLPIRYAIGADINNPNDSDTSDWAWSGKRPAELVNREALNYDYYLTTAKPPKLGFSRADATRNIGNIEEDIKKYWPDQNARPNVVTIFTTLYELEPEVASSILSNAAEMVSQDGVVLIQEPVDFGADGANFYDDFRIPGVYKLYAWWPHKNQGPEWLATYDSGSCHAAYLNPDRLRSALKRV